MVFVKDEGSRFDAPIDVVWRYIEDGAVHDSAHKTTRNPKFGKVSDITFLYGSDRFLRGKWAPDRLRITMAPPVSIITEWIEGVLEGSKLVYVYSPEGDKTRIDVYGEFTSKTLPKDEVEAAAREFLESEFAADAPAIREYAKKAKQ
jgi:hypothetical protein